MPFRRIWIGRALCAFALSVLFSGSALAASLTLEWDPNAEVDVAGYIVYYGSSPGVYTSTVDVGKITSWTAANLTIGQPYYFAVQVYIASGLRSALSDEVTGTPNAASFTDNVLTAGSSTIRAVHISELRTRIDAVRGRLGLAPFAWTDPVLTAGTATLRAQHFIDLRAALAQAYSKAHLTPPSFTDPSLGAGTTIRVAHVAEIRAAVIAIE